MRRRILGWDEQDAYTAEIDQQLHPEEFEQQSDENGRINE